MRYRVTARMGLSRLVPFLLLFAEPAMAAMKIATATIPRPENDKATLLASLTYSGRWTIALTSIRFQAMFVVL